MWNNKYVMLCVHIDKHNCHENDLENKRNFSKAKYNFFLLSVDFGLKYEPRHVFERFYTHENNLKECQIPYLRGILF